MKVEVNGQIFELEKPSGYKLLKVTDNSDPADQVRDLIFISLKEPKLTKEEIENLDANTFFVLAAKVNELLADDLKNLQTLMKSEEK